MNPSSNTKLQRTFYVLATIGTALTLVILATSLLLRLATEATLDGHTQSVLPPALEEACRLMHRLTASGVGLLALILLLMCLRKTSLAPGTRKASAWVFVTTVGLAVIGPLTPGYRIEAITVLNVGLGSMLLMALWRLREISGLGTQRTQPLKRIAQLTLIGMVLHIASGGLAAANSQWLPNLGLTVWLHVATAVGLMVLIALLLRQRRAGTGAIKLKALRYLMAGQILLGGLLLVLNLRPIWLNFSHGMVSAILAMLLLTLMHRQYD